MNQNKDCNCNDGIQKADMSDRYPYANDPNAALQNMDYKDWLVMGQERGGNPESLAEVKDAVNAGVAMVGTLMWTFGNPAFTGPLGGAICAVGLLIPLLWPEEQNPKKIWEEFMNNGETFFGKKIQDNERNRALAYLEAIKNKLEDYERALKEWEKDKNKETARRVSTEFNDVEGEIESALPHLKLNGYEPVLLTCYAEAALLHLNLLQQGVAFQSEWDKDVHPSRSAGSKFWKEKLMRRIGEYIDYCTKTYKDGLDTLKKDPNITWYIYNTYRREMTLTVLDLIALFPNYDVDKYPKGTRSELTREIYIPLSNEIIDSVMPFDEGERLLTRKPHQFTWMRSLRFLTRDKMDTSNKTCLGDVVFQYQYTKNDDTFNLASKDEYTQNFELGSRDEKITRLEVERYNTELVPNPNGIREIMGKVVTPSSGQSIKDYLYAVEKKGGNTRKNDVEGPSVELEAIKQRYGHQLSSVFVHSRTKGYYGRIYIYSFGWTHDGVDPENTIAEDTITQIPAVKASSVSGKNKTDYVVKGPGHTGGDLVKFKGYTRITMKCKTPIGQSYKIRIRYAANKEGKLIMHNWHNGQTIEKTLSKTYSDDDYTKYGSFEYVDFVEREVMNVDNTLFDLYDSMTNNPDTTILVDRIEFIPLD
ncbi:insecticidal delta-endotoxin Cry8Ea1 family protein [Bacillus albus]|uniref:insecticidal delta-endotoxin Cry8Ea1 family protein n=1 Tax=Bacillus albus TaxID=2026189 RepID=UPI0010202A35|nr:insecticidal delta-endotoxin Cry8Ea1 family protein [Bacillus albus]